ncbi:MAG: hypothetical protein M0T71_06225 [Actinomycetota bacterium]|nr:hypothetical protein [Actinomycetota bacterium]
MHPIERLRFVARSTGAPPAELAFEAAEALASLAREPRALVPACRRLLEAQPHNAPLWWVSAHVLAAVDPEGVAQECARRLLGDLTPLELTYALPAGARVAIEAAASALAGLAERPDLELRLVGGPLELRAGLAELAGGIGGGPPGVGHRPDEVEAALLGAGLVVVEAEAASSREMLLRPVGADLARAAAAGGIARWVVVGTGRVLPEPLFARCVAGSPGLVVEVALATQVVGPNGRVDPSAGLDPGDCPVPGSLSVAPRRR